MDKSLIEHAYDFVSAQKEPISFAKIWEAVKEAAGLSEEEALAKVSRFYTNLTLDGRFVTLGENNWDLRSRHTFDKVHIDMKDVYSDVETSDDDQEDDEEEKEYNEVFEEPKDEDDEKSESDSEDDEEDEEL